jgi:sulfite exporter TauE/SafE
LTQIKVGTLFLCDFRRVSDPIAFLAAHCASIWQPGPRAAASLLGMFLLGLAGSFSHCGAMCGPLVIGQVTDRLAAIPAQRLCESHRLRTGLLLSYHAGRLMTYAALGAACGAAGLAFVSRLAPVREILLFLAASMLLLIAAGRLPRGGGAFSAWPFRWIRGINRARAGGTFLFGMVLGLLPCGLLYAALVGACALATPVRGAAGMLAFGMGTVPVLALVGIAGQLRPLRTAFARALPWVMVFNACVLLGAAIEGLLI